MMSRAVTVVLLVLCFHVPLGAQDPAPSDRARTEALLEALAKLKISGYIQAQYVDSEAGEDTLSGGGTRNRDQFTVRRGRIGLSYRAAPSARFVMSVDASSSGTELKDGYVELTEPWTSWGHNLTLGQFVWPFGFENEYSAASREVPEHSRVVRTLFPGERDRGVMVSGEGPGERFVYRVAVVNGTGTGETVDLDSRKDWMGNVRWNFGRVRAGASVYEGEALLPTADSPGGLFFDKTRIGMDVQAETPVPGLTLRGELITGEEKGKDVAGWYVYAVQRLGTRHDLALRADDYDPDRDVSGDATLTTTLAYSFHWDSSTKLMLALEDPRREEDDVDDRMLTARIQYRF